LWNTSKRSQ